MALVCCHISSNKIVIQIICTLPVSTSARGYVYNQKGFDLTFKMWTAQREMKLLILNRKE